MQGPMPIIGQEPCAAPSVDSFPERRQVKEHLGSRGRVSSLVLGGICRSIFWASCLHSWTSQYKVSCKIKRTFHVLLLPFKPLWRIFTVGASGASGRRLSFSMKSDGASPSVAIFFFWKSWGEVHNILYLIAMLLCFDRPRWPWKFHLRGDPYRNESQV